MKQSKNKKKSKANISNLLKRCDKRWEDMIRDCYGEPRRYFVEGRAVSFDEKDMREIAGGENLTYDDFIELQIKSLGKYRFYFERVKSDCMESIFKGRIIEVSDRYVCFSRIYVSGIYFDGDGFSGKEDHVWMERKGLEDYQVGDCLQFEADVYRHVKGKNEKILDYDLRNPHDIQKIASYKIPSEEDLMKQAIDEMICQTMCMHSEHCYGFCIANENWREETRKMLFEAMTKEEQVAL